MALTPVDPEKNPSTPEVRKTKEKEVVHAFSPVRDPESPNLVRNNEEEVSCSQTRPAVFTGKENVSQSSLDGASQPSGSQSDDPLWLTKLGTRRIRWRKKGMLF